MPQPSAVISVPTSTDASILSKRAFSTFRILPLSGRMAWKRRSRPCLAEPPAESPSTKKISQKRGSRGREGARKGGVAPLLGRAAGGIAFDEEDLAEARIALGAVGELAGE